MRRNNLGLLAAIAAGLAIDLPKVNGMFRMSHGNTPQHKGVRIVAGIESADPPVQHDTRQYRRRIAREEAKRHHV